MKIINLLKAKINIYQVGDIIMRANDRNPSLDFGGTWVLWGAGRVPVCVDTTDTDFNTSEKTGGEKEHTLTIDELPTHTISTASQGANADGYIGRNGYSSDGTYNFGGNNGSHNNLQPYITCYMYKKTA